jgi:hypothetical protein
MPKKATKAPTRGQALVNLLNEPIDSQNFQAPGLTFRDFLRLLDQQIVNFTPEVPILVDFAAFQQEIPDAYKEESDLYDLRVRIPAFPKRLPAATVLRLALGQFPTRNATYLIRRGAIEITTLTQAAPLNLARQKVSAVFDRRPLTEAVQELSNITGASINIDPHIGDKGDTLVTATFAYDVSLKTALNQLTDMAGVKALFLDEGLYVTTAEHAEALHKERKALQREELWRMRKRLPNPGELPPPAQPNPGAGAGA